jgi:hypothetical protein
MWQRMRTGSATKGAKDYDWAMIEVTPDDTPEGQDDGHALLLLTVTLVGCARNALSASSRAAAL